MTIDWFERNPSILWSIELTPQIARIIFMGVNCSWGKITVIIWNKLRYLGQKNHP